ncbi:MAG TPA: M28 family peptidase [Flavobacteriaceae bacterium]|jgi:Zn-dependent M28 family amino/carboxypeptidase|nr:M28 family peptidase [Flavobacteriaceae bacterium]HIN99659.1 M28 family peptidase [Flavobacteriaceae bacterium]|tara:strand:- start:140993 stop:142003 length:1011 start_codon:yes stop_codon:yes gene_type:complete
MMKLFLISSLALLAVACNSTKSTESKKMTQAEYASTITADDLKEHLYIFADDKMQGRMTGTQGQKLAAEYLRNFYMDQGITSPIEPNNYYQNIPAEYFSRMKEPAPSENVVAFIKGSEKPDEVIVLSAHYDHVGVENGEVFNGADDDGSGTVSMLEMAEAFQQAVKNGQGPKRSILFLHVTGEEIGLYGSRYYTENPLFPLENTVANLNTDMIGRIDPDKKDNPNYIYLIGSDKLSQGLHDLSEQVAAQYSDLELDYTYNDENDPNRFYYRSDHFNFAKNNVPIIFYFNGTHEDYHQPTDTPDKIEYELMAKRAQLIFHTAWQLANQEERITADKL